VGELRLYAIGVDEVRGMFGASGERAAHLREIARTAFAPQSEKARGGLIGKLGPIFRRPPGALVLSPTQPVPRDLEVLLAGAYVPPDRTAASWRLLEALVAGSAWGSTRLSLDDDLLEHLDFAVARGGVPAHLGLRQLLQCSLQLNLHPVSGLTVGWDSHDTAVAMAYAYQEASPRIEVQHQDVVASLVQWLNGFPAWAEVAPALGRPKPDLLAFWAN
jgi:hypothetical protein